MIVLLADFQVLNQLQVGIGIFAVQVLKEPAPMANELEQAAAGMMIFGVGFEMPGQLVQTSCHEGNLNFGRSGVTGLGYNSILSAACA